MSNENIRAPQDRRALLSDYNNDKRQNNSSAHLEEVDEKPEKTRVGFSLDVNRSNSGGEIPIIVIPDSDDEPPPPPPPQSSSVRSRDGGGTGGFESESDDDENERTADISRANQRRKSTKRTIRRSRSSLSLESDADEDQPIKRGGRKGGGNAKPIAPRPRAPNDVPRVSTARNWDPPFSSAQHKTKRAPAPKRQRLNPQGVVNVSKDTSNRYQPLTVRKSVLPNNSMRERMPIEEAIEQIRPCTTLPPLNIGKCRVCGNLRKLTSRGDVCQISCIAQKPLTSSELAQYHSSIRELEFRRNRENAASNGATGNPTGGELDNDAHDSNRVRPEPPSEPDEPPFIPERVVRPVTSASSNPRGPAVPRSTAFVPSTQSTSNQPKSLIPHLVVREESLTCSNPPIPDKQQFEVRPTASEGNRNSPVPPTTARNQKKSRRKRKKSNTIPVLNISNPREDDETARSRLLFFSHRPRSFDASVVTDIEACSPFASATMSAGYSKSLVCSVCSNADNLTFKCVKCELAFHIYCIVPSLRSYNPSSPRCRGCESAAQENEETEELRILPSYNFTGFERLIVDASSGNPISFVLHPSLYKRFLRLYKTDYLRCSQCGKLRNVDAPVLSECVDFPFQCRCAYWSSGLKCDDAYSADYQSTAAIIDKKRALRSRRRARLFYSGFGEKHRHLFGFPTIGEVIELDVDSDNADSGAVQQTTPTRSNTTPSQAITNNLSQTKNSPTIVRDESKRTEDQSMINNRNVPSNHVPVPNQSGINNSSAQPRVATNPSPTQLTPNKSNNLPTASVPTSSVPSPALMNNHPTLSLPGITVSMQPATPVQAGAGAGVVNRNPNLPNLQGLGQLMTALANNKVKTEQKGVEYFTSRAPPVAVQPSAPVIQRSTTVPLPSTSAPVQPSSPVVHRNTPVPLPSTTAPVRPSAPVVQRNTPVPLPSTTAPVRPSAPVVHRNTPVPLLAVPQATSPVLRTTTIPSVHQVERNSPRVSAVPPTSSVRMVPGRTTLSGAGQATVPNQLAVSQPFSMSTARPSQQQLRQQSVQATPLTSPTANVVSNAYQIPNPTSNNQATTMQLQRQANSNVAVRVAAAHTAALRAATNAARTIAPPPTSTSPRNTEEETKIAKQWIMDRIGKLDDLGDVENELVDLVLNGDTQMMLLYNSFRHKPEKFDSQFIRYGKVIQEKGKNEKSTPVPATPAATGGGGPRASLYSNGRPLTPTDRNVLNERFRQIRLRQMGECIQLERELLNQMQLANVEDVGRVHQQHYLRKKQKADLHTAQIRALLQTIPGRSIVRQSPQPPQPQPPPQIRTTTLPTTNEIRQALHHNQIPPPQSHRPPRQ